MSLTPKDLTPVYQETIGKGAGARRWQRPVYVDHLPPCNHACPAGENIQAWLALAQAGDYERAWRKYMEENPLPGTHGRACYHPCESACNRKFLDQAVSIHSLDRFLGDLANEKGWTIASGQPTGKRVLVVGAGPAGLSCAYHLRRFGHDVEIRDANSEPGGMMHYGIPAYRLPREGLDKEIARIEAMGVTIVRNARVNDVLAEKAAGSFDAVFLGIGAQVANHLDIPAMDGGKIIDAVTLMERVEKGRAPALGRVVGIVGGGNTAMDAARMAKRLGRRRGRDHLPLRQGADGGPSLRSDGSLRRRREDQVAVHGQAVRRGRDRRRADGDAARRLRLRGHRAVPDAQDRFAGARRRTACRRRVPEEGARPPHRPWQRRRSGRADARERRHLRGRRHDRRSADHDGGGRPRQEGGAPHRRVAAGRRLRETAAASAGPVRAAQPDRVPRCRSARARRAAGGETHGIRRNRVRPLGARSALRGHAVPLLRQLLRVRQLLRGVSRAGDRQAGEGPVLPGRARPLHRMRHVLRTVPVSCHRHGARAGGRGTGRAHRSARECPLASPSARSVRRAEGGSACPRSRS